MRAIVAITTAGTEDEAYKLAEELVARRQAACVNVLPVSRSIYRWQGKICQDSEYLLVIKSQEGSYPAIQATIQELHSYDLPEILCFNVGQGEPDFLRWIAEATDEAAVDEAAEE